jgi:hypothetical protein
LAIKEFLSELGLPAKRFVEDSKGIRMKAPRNNHRHRARAQLDPSGISLRQHVGPGVRIPFAPAASLLPNLPDAPPNTPGRSTP